MSEVVTPASIESRMRQLGREIYDATKELQAAERSYYDAKTAYEIGMARERLRAADPVDPQRKLTVAEREDLALLANEGAHRDLYIAEATRKAAQANVVRIRVQADLARSIGTSVRTSLDL